LVGCLVSVFLSGLFGVETLDSVIFSVADRLD